MNIIGQIVNHSFALKGRNSNRFFCVRTTRMQNTQSRPARFIPIGLFNECAPFT